MPQITASSFNEEIILEDQFIQDFLAINPTPTAEQCKQLLFSIGVNEYEESDFVTSVLKAAAKRQKLCALTEPERVLINDYDPALTETDNLLINDGDNLHDELDVGNQAELGQDGIIDNSSIEAFFYHNSK